MSREGELFCSFIKIGLFTFGGGYAMIPLIEKEIIDKRGWIKRKDFLELLTLAQSAPGPLALNASVFVGYKVYGYKGALASILGVIMPSFFIILFIAMFFANIKDNRFVVAAFNGIRPAVVALIVSPIFTLAKGLGVKELAVSVIAAVVVWYFGISPIYCIVAGAVSGVGYTIYQNTKKIKS